MSFIYTSSTYLCYSGTPCTRTFILLHSLMATNHHYLSILCSTNAFAAPDIIIILLYRIKASSYEQSSSPALGTRSFISMGSSPLTIPWVLLPLKLMRGPAAGRSTLCDGRWILSNAIFLPATLTMKLELFEQSGRSAWGMPSLTPCHYFVFIVYALDSTLPPPLFFLVCLRANLWLYLTTSAPEHLTQSKLMHPMH